MRGMPAVAALSEASPAHRPKDAGVDDASAPAHAIWDATDGSTTRPLGPGRRGWATMTYRSPVTRADPPPVLPVEASPSRRPQLIGTLPQDPGSPRTCAATRVRPTPSV